MTIFSNTFGLAMRNFTTYPEMPDPQALIAYAVKAEELGFDSVWVWDHIFLGVDPPFPVINSLTLLGAVAARTTRIKLGTGVLVLPLRNPVVLAKELSSLDLIAGGRLLLGMASGWYKREFDAVGVPFNERGRIMDRNLEILRRLWTEEQVDGEYPPHRLRGSNMSPKPSRLPVMLIGGYVDRVLKRAALNGGWLTYFYTPEGFAKSWAKVRGYAEEAGKDPASLLNANQLPIYVGPSRAVGRGADDGMARPGVGLRRLERLDEGRGDLRHRRRMRGAIAGAACGRRPEADLHSVPVPNGSGRDHRPRDHPSAARHAMKRDDRDVLLIVDVQNDFCPGGALAVPHGDQIVPAVNRLAAEFAHVVLTQDWHPRGHASFASSHPGKQPFDTIDVPYGQQILWPDHCVQGTRGADVSSRSRGPACRARAEKGLQNRRSIPTRRFSRTTVARRPVSWVT